MCLKIVPTWSPLVLAIPLLENHFFGVNGLHSQMLSFKIQIPWENILFFLFLIINMITRICLQTQHHLDSSRSESCSST